MHCSTADCKNEEQQWSQGDTECIMKGGTCQFNSLVCGSGKRYHSEWGCGGPTDRQCCAPDTLPPTQPPTSPTVPTVPTDGIPITPDSGSGGQTAGIVIGVLFGIVVSCTRLY